MTTIYPEYVNLLDYAFNGIDQSVEEFQGYRFQMKYHSVPTDVVLQTPKFPEQS